MLFPTFSFAIFFLCVFVCFRYVYRGTLQRKIFLAAASYLFYAFGDWRYCFLLLFLSLVNYYFGIFIGKNRDHIKRKTFLVLAVIVNLSLLGFFKYWHFFANTANGLILSFFPGATFAFTLFKFLMPLGISFYTFKALSYIFDIYLCKMAHVTSFLDVLNYLSFFPQIASGPIVHAHDFFPDMKIALESGLDSEPRSIEMNRATLLILCGLLKKLIFANYLSTLLVDPVFSDLASHHSLDIILAAFGYSVVIYCDFSGYSDMAIGIALFFGFHTPKNFNSPYISFSVSDFWRRWHITFSSWLRDYLYFSLGGSRFGLLRTLFALFFTMILGGLWHGASWTFILWGAMQGAALAFERVFNYGLIPATKRLTRFGQIGLTFLFTTLSWVVFRSDTFDSLALFFRSLINFTGTPVMYVPLVCILLVLGLGMHAIPRSFVRKCFNFFQVLPLVLKAIAVSLFFVFLSIVGMSGVAPFIYFQF